MTYIAYGAGATGMQTLMPLGSHSPQMWGSAKLAFPQVNIGASAVITTSQGYCINPYQWFYIYNFVVAYTATGAGAYTVDLYNAVSGGTSYLNAPMTLTTVIPASGVAVNDARFTASPVLKIQSDPLLFGFGVDTGDWTANNSFPTTAVFSLRVTSPGGGSITGLQAYVAGFVSNEQSFGLV